MFTIKERRRTAAMRRRLAALTFAFLLAAPVAAQEVSGVYTDASTKDLGEVTGVAALKGIPILARAASLVAHLLEEQQRPIGFVLSHAAGAAIEYDGTRPDGFVPSKE